jgi:nucleotide-binding universal stress UspA family protein
MKTAGTETRLALRSILFLTDFSEPSEVALPFAMAISREYGAKVHVLHVMIPTAYAYSTPESTAAAIDAQAEYAECEMARVTAQLAGLPRETMIEYGTGLWPTVEQAIGECEADIVVLGTHGRTGAQKLLMGSVAEEIFRLSRVPVLTVGPGVRSGAHNSARFHSVLLATDFSPESVAAAPYAISLAQENQARLFLLHVIANHKKRKGTISGELSVGNVMYHLNEMVAKDVELWCRPEAVIDYGQAAERILANAGTYAADLIVLGVRGAAGRLETTTHLSRSTAHLVVAHATCPVLTVRG